MELHALTEALFRNAAERPDKTALIENEIPTTWGELADLAAGAASYLLDRGLHPGEIVMLRTQQALAFVAVYLGVRAAGGVPAPLERNGPAGIAPVADSLQSHWMLGSEADQASGAVSTAIPLEEVFRQAKTAPRRSLPTQALDGPSDVLFTTGTTGRSKGVLHTNRSVLAIGRQQAGLFGMEKDTVLVLPGPINHAGNIWCLWASVLTGGAFYLLNGMSDLKAFYRALRWPEGHLACHLAPSAVRTLFTLSGDQLGQYNGRLEWLLLDGAPVPEPDRERLRALLPDTALYIHMGASETGSISSYRYQGSAGFPGCVGLAAPGVHFFFTDEHRNVLEHTSPEHPGLLACNGPTLMAGYVNAPEATAQAMPDGNVYLNDLAWQDDSGYLYVLGRADDVINVGGLKVSPVEVEEAALALPGIRDCICIAIPHPISGQALKLLVVPDPAVPFHPRAIIAALHDSLEWYKVPARLEQTDAVRRMYNGKPDRKSYRT